MNVTAELLDTFEFRKKGRGYDPEQVDELIARVRSTLGDLETRVADVTSRAETAEARSADAEARSRASSESDETIQRTLLLAQRTADAAVQEAEETAATKVGDAEAEAKRLVEEADEARARALANAEEEVQRAAEESRTRLAQEIGALEQIRNTLMGDVERLEEHIDLERSRLRESSDALTDILSRSDRLGQVEIPELSDVDPSAAEASAVAPEAAPDSELAVTPAALGRTEADAVTVSQEDEPARPAALGRTEADAVTVSQENEPARPAEVIPSGVTGIDWSGGDASDTIDAPPPPPPPPSGFDDDVDAIDEPPPPPPPPAIDELAVGVADDATLATASPVESATGFGGLGGGTGDFDADDAEDNAWLAELAKDDTDSGGTGEGDRRPGRRR